MTGVGLLLATVRVGFVLVAGDSYQFCYRKVGTTTPVVCVPYTTTGQSFTVPDDYDGEWWVKDQDGNESAKSPYKTDKKKLATPILTFGP